VDCPTNELNKIKYPTNKNDFTVFFIFFYDLILNVFIVEKWVVRPMAFHGLQIACDPKSTILIYNERQIVIIYFLT